MRIRSDGGLCPGKGRVASHERVVFEVGLAVLNQEWFLRPDPVRVLRKRGGRECYYQAENDRGRMKRFCS